ncbi:MAG: hypothetical protein ETSY1_40530 [Candidatus Entotheonella factor]|uniref:SHSP domain-containing protein n=1 Tax=Entotheonella factor TaxID=1429438 RepID=W4L4W4_ENTF1|nr:Hsp20/alpha crystallin family protein [Candidatus Entotheonella palauensis]ETW93143.1 MAG: hypothetical protein ETSY1_40530 [Candidatus Entotheonella factor]
MIQHAIWKELDNVRREMENAMHGWSDFPVNGSPFAHWVRGMGYPNIRVHQDEESVKVEAVIPGVDPDSLALSIEDKTLILSGDKPSWAGSEKSEVNGKAEGSFKRSVELPVKVDADQATAEYVHGVLSITMPKAQEAKARKIEVAVG